MSKVNSHSLLAITVASSKVLNWHLYGSYVAVLLRLPHREIKSTCSVKVRFHYDGDLFDPSRLKFKDQNFYRVHQRSSVCR